MKKLVVDPNACIGCGACVAIDPEHFAFNEEGFSHAIAQENLESKNVLEAVDACPTSAIHIDERQCDCDKEEEKATKEEHVCHCNHCDECENKA